MSDKDKICVAVLDGEGRYFGTKEVDADAMPVGAVEVPRGCDLPADGSYRHDKTAKAFVKPPPTAKGEAVNFQAETVAALAGIGFAMRAADMPLPPLTLRWLAWFEGTLDYTGLLTKPAQGGRPAMPLVKPGEFKG